MADPIHLDPNADDQRLLAQIVGYYHATLKTSPEAQEYLRKKGFNHPSLVAYFRLGYSDRTLGLQLPSKDSRAGQAIRARLQRLGVFRSTGHELFPGSITVPIPTADGAGAVANVYGRKILDGHLRKGTAYDTYLHDDRRGVWNVEAFGGVEEVILCSSVLDALTFWNFGYRNTTCMFGPDALTADLLAAFAEFHIKRVLTTSEGVVEKLLAAGLEVFHVRLPVGHDANAFALKIQDPADALGSLLRNAEWMGKGKPATAPVIAPTPPPEVQNDPVAELFDADAEEDGDEAGESDDLDEPGEWDADDLADSPTA